jgi:hypothetical protein
VGFELAVPYLMVAMFDAEITAACQPKGKHDPGQAGAAVRHGSGYGLVLLGGRQAVVTPPGVRTAEGHHMPLASYMHFAADDLPTQPVLERMTAHGTKKPIGLWNGSTENKAVVHSLLADFVGRALAFDDGLRLVLDGAKVLSAAVQEVFGDEAFPHKGRNVADHVPDEKKARADAKQVKAFNHADPDQGVRETQDLTGLLAKSFPGAAADLIEGLDEMSTTARRGIDGRLAKPLTTSNPVSSR